MKLTVLTIAVTLMTLVIPSRAKASLGGDLTSVQADKVRLQGTLRSTSNGLYTIQEVKAPTGVLVREYVSSAGKVFAVAWQGPTRPDLRQILGSYFDAFTEAVQAKRASRVVRGPLAINQAGLVVEMGGHMRWFVGRAYVSAMMPAEVRTEDIR